MYKMISLVKGMLKLGETSKTRRFVDTFINN